MDILQLSFLVLLGVQLSLQEKSGIAIPSEEARLVSDLMSNYNKHVKPTIDPNGKVTVNITFTLARVEGLNEKDQVLTTFGWITALWYDETLRWNPADYGGAFRITLPYTEVWLPEIAMLNSVAEGNDLGFASKFRVTVFANGLVQWGPGFKWETSCSINLVYFPFDEHVCKVEFVNWMYGADYLEYKAVSTEVNTAVFVPNDAWNLTKTHVNATTRVITVDGVTMKIPQISFSLYLQRNPTYHTWNVLVPNLLMTLVSLLVYMMPSESGEKVGMAMTVLLGYSVILLMVSEITPQSGDTMPLMSIYIVISMVTVALCLTLTILVLSTFHHSPHKPPPGWVRQLVLGGLASVLCMVREDLDKPLNKVQPENSSVVLEDIDQKKADSNTMNLPPYLVAYIKKKVDDDADNDEIEHNRALWQHLANVLDRFFLVVTFVVIVAMLGGFTYHIVTGDTYAFKS